MSNLGKSPSAHSEVIFFAGSYGAPRELTAEERATMITQIAGARSEDALRHVWLFDANLKRERPGPDSGVTPISGDGFIVYPFDDARLLYYRDGLLRPAKEIYFLSLDSNMSDKLSAFFATPEISSPTMWALLARMRAWRRFDVQSYFHTLEHFAKAQLPLPPIRKNTENLLRLHALDLEVTLASGKPCYNSDTISRQVEIFGTTDFVQMADRASENFIMPNSIKDLIRAIYSALLKMVLIRRSLRSYRERVEAFDDFLEHGLGFESLRLNVIARYYFLGQFGRLLGVQDNSTRANALPKLRAAAWDVYYASSGERCMTFREPPEGLLPVLITCDRALAEVTSMFEIKSVAVFSDGGIRTNLRWTDSFLRPVLGEKGVRDDLARLSRRVSKPYHILDIQNVDAEALEAQL